jgi:hypothetical protein
MREVVMKWNIQSQGYEPDVSSYQKSGQQGELSAMTNKYMEIVHSHNNVAINNNGRMHPWGCFKMAHFVYA